MAIKIETEFPGKSNAGDANYPQGSHRDIITSGDGTGTPRTARGQNDTQGLLQKLLDVASITPSGSPDTVLASDYFDGLMTLVSRPTLTVATMTAIVGVRDGDVFNVAERSTDNGGGGFWTAITTGSTPDVDLPNTFNIIVGVSDPLISFVLRINGEVKPKQFGVVGDEVADDKLAVQATIDFAVANNLIVNWDGVNCLVTGNITDLHNVEHIGNGSILRGSDTFFLDPKESRANENTLYVSSTGLAINDGITSAIPFRTNEVSDNLSNYGSYLDGRWTIKFAAGTYTATSASMIRIGPDNDSDDQAQAENQLASANYVQFRGPDVGYDPTTLPKPTPTAIFDGNNLGTVLLGFRGGFRAYVIDIKFIQADGSASSAGIECTNGALRTENVHTSDCTFGISGTEGCQIEVKGGDLEGSSTGKANTGIRSIFNTKHDIGEQSAGSDGQGPFIHNCNIGLFCQEGATGHSDFVTYEDNDWAIRTKVHSRVNVNGSNFARNGACGMSETSSNIGVNGNEVLNLDSVDANDSTWLQTYGGSIWYVSDSLGGRLNYARNSQFIDIDVTSVTLTGSVAETNYYILDLPKGFLNVIFNAKSVAPKIVKISVRGTFTDDVASTRQFRVRLGGSSIGTVSVDAAKDGVFELEHMFMIEDTTSLLVDSWNKVQVDNPATVNASRFSDITVNTLDDDAQLQLRLTTIADDVGDTITFDHVFIETINS